MKIIANSDKNYKKTARRMFLYLAVLDLSPIHYVIIVHHDGGFVKGIIILHQGVQEVE